MKLTVYMFLALALGGCSPLDLANLGVFVAGETYHLAADSRIDAGRSSRKADPTSCPEGQMLVHLVPSDRLACLDAGGHEVKP